MALFFFLKKSYVHLLTYQCGFKIPPSQDNGNYFMTQQRETFIIPNFIYTGRCLGIAVVCEVCMGEIIE